MMTDFLTNSAVSTVGGQPIGVDDFRHLAEAIPQLVWTSDPSGNVDYISPQMGKFSGVDPSSPDYLDWSKVVHPEDLAELNSVWNNCIETGEVYEHEFRMKAEKSTYHWFSARAIPVFGEDGKIVKWYGSTTNIDSLKKAEAVLRNLADEKDRFIAILGHELRNPLSAISNSYENLTHDAINEDQRGRALASLGRQLGYLKRLVEETLDISRLASGKFRLLPTKVELNHLVETCVADMEHKISEEEISVQTKFSESEIWAKVDGVRISQCIFNLLNNAVKFTSPGGTITVECRLDSDTGLAEIQVADDGVGMTKQELARIFQPFSQGRSAGRLSREGLGLGLAITSEIIGLHGGDVSVASEGKGKGSAFTLNIPVSTAPTPSAPVPEEVPNSSPTQKILLVDDDKGVTATLKMFLELDGHSVSVVHCGRTALGALDAGLPDLVICDLTLPGTIKGWDVAKRITKNYPEEKAPYLIALSGHAEPHHIKKCLEAGFDEHLSKPTSPDDLRKAVARGAAS